MALPTLQLGDIGTPRTGQRKLRQTGQEAAAGPQPQAQASGAPQTFAQMQASGVARPAPPAQGMMQGPPRTIGPSTPPPSVKDSLQQSVTQALTTPSPYNSDTFKALRDSATNDITNQYGKIRETTDTGLARRGLSASSIAANDLHDVDSAQSRALADLNSKLLGDAATTQGQYQTQAIGAGQNYVNAENSQNLNQQQQDLAKMLGLGNLDLSKQAQSNQVNQFGQTLDFQKQGAAAQQQQFLQQLAQQMGIAQMGDKTANRGIDASSNQQQQDFIFKLAQILGIPTGTLQSLTGGSTPPAGTTAPPPAGPSTGNPGNGQGTNGIDGGTGAPTGTSPALQTSATARPPSVSAPTGSTIVPRESQSVQDRLAQMLNGVDSHPAGAVYNPANLSSSQQTQTVESGGAGNGMTVPNYLSQLNTPGSDVFKAQGDPTADSSPYFWDGKAWTLKQQGNGYVFDPATQRYVKAGG